MAGVLTAEKHLPQRRCGFGDTRSFAHLRRLMCASCERQVRFFDNCFCLHFVMPRRAGLRRLPAPLWGGAGVGVTAVLSPDGLPPAPPSPPSPTRGEGVALLAPLSILSVSGARVRSPVRDFRVVACGPPSPRLRRVALAHTRARGGARRTRRVVPRGALPVARQRRASNAPRNRPFFPDWRTRSFWLTCMGSTQGPLEFNRSSQRRRRR